MGYTPIVPAIVCQVVSSEGVEERGLTRLKRRFFLRYAPDGPLCRLPDVGMWFVSLQGGYTNSLLVGGFDLVESTYQRAIPVYGTCRCCLDREYVGQFEASAHRFID